MSALVLQRLAGRMLFGCKGPRAAEWLAAQGVAIPAAPNTYTGVDPDGLVVARLGSSEFFVEEGAPAGTVPRLAAAHAAGGAAGVYPVLREDWALGLGGEGAEELLAQVCNVHFGALHPATRPVIMTLMAGVAVLIVPQGTAAGTYYRFWFDPTYGPYLCTSLRGVVADCGGTYRGNTA